MEGSDMGNNENIVWNVSGGQVNVASGNAIINATQNERITSSELNNLINSIKDNLSNMQHADVENIIDIIDMAKEELEKPEPKASRLRNCVTLLAPMITIANGTPTLVDNLQKFQEFIMQFIK